MNFDMLEYYKMIKDNNVSIIYSGIIMSEGIKGIEGIGSVIKKHLEFDELPLSASQSVFSVFVEQMNNISIYSAENENNQNENNQNENNQDMHKQNTRAAEDQLDPLSRARTDLSKGVFILGAYGKTYFIQSGNIISNENAEFVRSKIDYINNLDKSALRKYYREQIKTDYMDLESREAGLGLIEVARRASSKIDYSLTPIEDNKTFFSMYVTIG